MGVEFLKQKERETKALAIMFRPRIESHDFKLETRSCRNLVEPQREL